VVEEILRPVLDVISVEGAMPIGGAAMVNRIENVPARRDNHVA